MKIIHVRYEEDKVEKEVAGFWIEDTPPGAITVALDPGHKDADGIRHFLGVKVVPISNLLEQTLLVLPATVHEVMEEE